MDVAAAVAVNGAKIAGKRAVPLRPVNQPLARIACCILKGPTELSNPFHGPLVLSTERLYRANCVCGVYSEREHSLLSF